MKKGRWGRGRPRYGYETDENKYLQIVPEEAEVVRKIYQWIADEGLKL